MSFKCHHFNMEQYSMFAYKGFVEQTFRNLLTNLSLFVGYFSTPNSKHCLFRVNLSLFARYFSTPNSDHFLFRVNLSLFAGYFPSQIPSIVYSG